MITEARNRALQSLYGPPSADLARPLPDIGDALATQLQALAMNPTPEGAELVAINLTFALRGVRLLQELLLRELGHVR